MTAAMIEPEALEALVAEYATLQARQAEITDRLNTIKAAIRDGLPTGSYTAAGLKVTIRAPSRTLNLQKAVALLPDEAKVLCQVTTYDAKKVKSLLAPAVLDLAYEPGTGNPVVSIS